MSGPRLGPYGLDAALQITKQLQEALNADVTVVETDPRATTIHLSIPRRVVGDSGRRRGSDGVWFVNENVHRRKKTLPAW
jgi:hypothetical protein